MTYREFIQNIIDTRGQFNCKGYHERHHIIPKCLGGTNDENNLIYLYPQEHYEAHKLLALENPNNPKLIYAWNMMHIRLVNNEQIEITAEEYEKLKLQFINILKTREYTKEIRQRMGDAHRGKSPSPKTREKIRQGNLGKIVSEETRKNISIAHLGKPLSEEHKRTLSIVKKGKKLKPISEERKEMISKSFKQLWQDDSYRNHMKEVHKGFKGNDETRKKLSKKTSNQWEIKRDKMLKAMVRSDEFKKKTSEWQSKARWYTNGKINTRCIPGTEPEGFKLGRLKKIWYNNGIENKQFYINEQPEGWVKGMLKKKTNNQGGNSNDYKI